jgi:hypothetical protein
MEFALASRTGGVPRVLDRRISNAGSIRDVRKRDPQQVFTTGGIQKFSLLGSQNAISYVPIAYPPKEAGTQTDKEKKDAGTETEKTILPGMTKKETSTGTDTGLLGEGTQSEASKKAMEERKAKEKSESAVEPAEQPPYYLPQEQTQLSAMVQYLQDRYGEVQSRKYVDDLEKDSKQFSEAVNKAKEIGKAINEWKAKDLGKEWLMNHLKIAGKWVLSQVTELAKSSLDFGTGEGGKMAGKVSSMAIDELKKVIEQSVLSPEHVEEELKAIQDALFSARPYWKAKWQELLSAEVARLKKEFREKFLKQYGPSTDDTSKDLFPTKKPKAKKEKKTMAMKI